MNSEQDNDPIIVERRRNPALHTELVFMQLNEIRTDVVKLTASIKDLSASMQSHIEQEDGAIRLIVSGFPDGSPVKHVEDHRYTSTQLIGLSVLGLLNFIGLVTLSVLTYFK